MSNDPDFDRFLREHVVVIPVPAPVKKKPQPQTADEQGLPRDQFGFPYRVDGFAYRVTECCGAATKYYDDAHCCKGCYEEVDTAYGVPAVLNPGEDPPDDSPVEVRLK